MPRRPKADAASHRQTSADGPRLGQPGALVSYSLAIGLFVVLTVVAMWPVFADLTGSVMGSVQPGDGTSGGVRLGWQLLALPPFAGHSRFLGAPSGAPFWQFTYDTAIVWIIPQWLTAHIAGAVASWNLALALGFVLDGVAMFALVRWLTRSTMIGLVAGVLYAFSPFHVEESYAHIGYVWTWIFPLILWSALALFRRPNLKLAVVAGGLIGLAGYIDPYFILFAPLFGVLLAVAGLLMANGLQVSRSSLVRAYAVTATTAVIVMAPLAVVYELAPASARAMVASRSSLRPALFQRAKPWEYFVPWKASPLWGRFTGSWVQQQLGTVQPTETSLYLGAGVMMLALGFWVCVVRRRFAPAESHTVNDEPAALPASLLGGMLFVLTVVLMLCSFSYVGPAPSLPTLAWSVVPLWRVFTRLQVVIDCLVVVSASLGLLLLARSRFKWMAWLFAALAIVDGTAIFPWSSWSYATHTAAAYSWLRRHPDGGIVANYPMLPAVLPAYQSFLTFQEVHRHPLFNGAPAGSLHAELEHGLAGVDDPQTVPALRAQHVRYVVLDRNYYDNRGSVNWGQVHMPGLKLIINSAGVRLYRVLPGPSAVAALTVISGFGVEHPFLPRIERWMGGNSAELGIERFSGSGPLRVSFRARSYKRPEPRRFLRVYQSGVKRWEGWVTVPGTNVSFVTSSAAPLTLRCTPGAVHLTGFLDLRSVNIINFAVSSAR